MIAEDPALAPAKDPALAQVEDPALDPQCHSACVEVPKAWVPWSVSRHAFWLINTDYRYSHSL